MQVAAWQTRLVGIAILLAACGRSTSEELQPDAGAAGSGGGVDHDGADTLDAPATEPCKTLAGVRLCGGACPALTAAECPGLGCVPVVDRGTGVSAGIGVCWADLPAPIKTCWICPDGSTCVHLEGQGPVCVTEDMCAALHQLGAGAGCRYADFSPYDGRPLAVATCPAGSCGPGCGNCLGICSGRSADYGYGMCFDAQDPVPCSPKQPLGKFCERCLTWLPVPGGDDLALDYGQCVVSYSCADYEATGRMSCNAAPTAGG